MQDSRWGLTAQACIDDATQALSPGGDGGGDGGVAAHADDYKGLFTTRDELRRAARDTVACPSCRALLVSLLNDASCALFCPSLLVEDSTGAIALSGNIQAKPEQARELLHRYRPQQQVVASGPRGGKGRKGGTTETRKCFNCDEPGHLAAQNACQRVFFVFRY